MSAFGARPEVGVRGHGGRGIVLVPGVGLVRVTLGLTELVELPGLLDQGRQLHRHQRLRLPQHRRRNENGRR